MTVLLKGTWVVPSEKILWAHGFGGSQGPPQWLLDGLQAVLEAVRGRLKIVVSAWKFEVVN